MGKTADAKKLILRGVSVNFQDEGDDSALYWASRSGKTDIVTLLLEHRANLNIATKTGNTPLICAAYRNHEVIVRTLVEAGADATIRGNKNKTAAEWAKLRGHYAIENFLTNIRFHSSARNKSGQLYHVRGRGWCAVERDLKENGIFGDHVLRRLRHFCVG